MNTVLVFQKMDGGAKSLGSFRDDQENQRGQNANFYSLILKAVDLALVATVGQSGAVAVKFYVETSLICHDPHLFEQSLDKLFGGSENGLGFIEAKMEKLLVDLLGSEYSVNIPVERWSKTLPKMSFSEFVLACKKEYHLQISR